MQQHTLEEAVERALRGEKTMVLALFGGKVAEVGECWEYTGYRRATGYGQIMRGSKTWPAHRWSYTQVIGPIPDGLLVRHTCDNPPCVRPSHLLVGTHADNRADAVERGRARGGNSYKTQCPRGHDYDTVTREGYRKCSRCHADEERRRRARAHAG